MTPCTVVVGLRERDAELLDGEVRRRLSMILDEAGRLVWFLPLRGDEQAFDFREQTYRGRPVLTWWQGRMAV